MQLSVHFLISCFCDFVTVHYWHCWTWRKWWKIAASRSAIPIVTDEEKIRAKFGGILSERQKRPVGKSRWMNETYIKVLRRLEISLSCCWQERPDHRLMLTTHRGKKAALRFFKKVIRQHALPNKVTIDKRGVNTAAIKALKEKTGQEIESRQIKYLNNRVEQDHWKSNGSSDRWWSLNPFARPRSPGKASNPCTGSRKA